MEIGEWAGGRSGVGGASCGKRATMEYVVREYGVREGTTVELGISGAEAMRGGVEKPV